ncbi:MAG: ABC transporter permease [Polyangiaceae bacterium]|nr:ABC transporter permease [Polyangiaceae bacterium]
MSDENLIGTGGIDGVEETPLSMDGASLALLRARKAAEPGFVSALFGRVLALVDHLGAMSLMTWRSFRALFTPPFDFRAIVYQLESVGVKSMGIVTVTSVFIGMVMAVQFAISLQKFGAMEYTGRVVGLSYSRELAPTLTAVIVGGRVGSGMAAEVGSMAVTEQIDAIRALGADPIKKLVMPRVIALIIGMPILSMFALVFGFSGAMLVTSSQFNIPAFFLLRSAIDTVGINDFLSGMCKCPFFGGIIALVGCYFGLTTRGGTEGVGKSTTQTVEVVSIAILIADFFLTKLYFLAFG